MDYGFYPNYVGVATSVDAELCVLRDDLFKYININSLAVENEIMQR